MDNVSRVPAGTRLLILYINQGRPAACSAETGSAALVPGYFSPSLRDGLDMHDFFNGEEEAKSERQTHAKTQRKIRVLLRVPEHHGGFASWREKKASLSSLIRTAVCRISLKFSVPGWKIHFLFE